MIHIIRVVHRLSRLWRPTAVVALAAGGCARDETTAPVAGEDVVGRPDFAAAPVATTIDLTLHPLTPDAGTVLVSSGIPLVAGALRADQLEYVRLFVEGEEQPIHVEALEGDHEDGSLRAILVQFMYSLAGGAPVAGRIELGSRRTLSGIAKTAVTWDTPEAIAVPSSTDYLVRSGIFGPTLPLSAAPTSPAYFVKYETDFAKYSDSHWIADGADWEIANYYDRARSHFAFWARTGEVKYWQRAALLVADYRREYLEPSSYRPPPHSAQLDGVELHYYLTGQEKSREAVVGTAAYFTEYVAGLGNLSSTWLEGRVQGRVLNSFILARRLKDTSRDWASILRTSLDNILSTQRGDGSYRWPLWCNQQSNYMTGILNDALIRYYEEFEADPRIPASVQRSLDFMWSTQWVASARAFKYLSGSCSNGSTRPAADESMLIVNGFGWYAGKGGGATYRDRGDEVFAGAVAKAWLVGSKQFNQQYLQSYQYLEFR